MLNVFAHLVTKQVTPIARLYFDWIDRLALAVCLPPVQRVIAVEVDLRALTVRVVGQVEGDAAGAVAGWLVRCAKCRWKFWVSWWKCF